VPDEDLTVTDFGEQIYKGAALSPPQIMFNERGTAMPADFNHDNARPSTNTGQPKVFIAAGGSLSCVTEYLGRKNDLATAKQEIEQELKRILPQLPASDILGAEDGDELAATCCFAEGENGKTEVWVRLDNNSKDTSQSIHSGDSAVALKDNEIFKTTGYSNGSFRIKPVRESELGTKLDNLFARLTQQPDLGSYWQLWNPTAPDNLTPLYNAHAEGGIKVPQLETIRGVHYLVYQTDPMAERDGCYPPGSIPVNTAEFLWLKDDIADEERGIKPAEPPQELSHLRPTHHGPRPT